MTSDPNITPEEELDVEQVDPEDPPLSEEEFPTEEDIEESEREPNR